MQQVIEEIKTRLYKDVQALCSIRPARNYANIAALNKASDYIMAEFQKLDCDTRFQNYKADNREYRNVIASFGAEHLPTVVIGAHYDVAGDQQGADDNASGVAGLLELARMLDQAASLPYRYELVAYSLEEPPYFGTEYMGSAIHAASLFKDKVTVKAMICLEMIGYFSDSPFSQGFPDDIMRQMYPNTGNFIIVVGRTGQEAFTGKVKDLIQKDADIDVQFINLPANLSLAGLSDHRNYWTYGYDAVMINDTSFLRNPNYHKKTDIPESLNYGKMAEVVKGVFGMCVEL